MSAKTKILIVEHDPNDIELIQHELKKGNVNYIAEIVETGNTYENALRNFVPDIILSDYSLPSFDGPAAFEIKEKISPHTPFIFVSGAVGEENSIELIKNGVTDFVLKDKLFTLTTKVNRALKESKENQLKIKAEQKRIQSESRLAKAQEIAHLGSWELDFATNISLWSDETCRIYGLAPGNNEHTFDSWLSFIYPEDLDFVLKKIKESQASFRGSSFHCRIIRKDGTIRYIYSESKFEFDSAGKPTGIYGIAHDITESKKVEEALKEKVNFIESIINASPDIIYIYDIEEEKNIYVNEGIQINLGYNDDEIKEMGNQLLSTLMHPEDFEYYLHKTYPKYAATKDKEIITHEYRMRDKNGAWRWLYCKESIFVRKPDETPKQLFGITTDITERKKTEQAIKESEEKYRTLVEQASDAIFITDTTGRFVTVNTSACKLSQYSEKELLQMTIYDFAITEDLQKNPFHFDELKQGKTVINERVMNRNNGIRLNIETTSRLLSDGRLLVFVRDISERKKAQNEIIKEKNLSDSIINSLPGIFYLYNMEGKFLRWNKNLETESKYSAKEIREMHPLDFFDEKEKEMLSRKIKNVFISGEETVQANFLLKTKEKIPYYFTGTSISYEGVPCLLGVGIDFSELKKTQQALAENENHLRVILQTNPECIKLTGINGELEEMNPAGLAMIEADSFEQIKGKSLLDFIDKPYRKAFSQLTQNVFKGKSGKLEFEITGLKGTHRWMETHAVPLKDEKGKIISLLGITRDITERKKTEKEILRAIERYDMIAKATSDTIWDWDITKDKILYNEGITNVFGYEKTKIENISEWLKTKIHPDDLQIVLEAIAAAFKKQSYNLQLEYRFRCADESFKYIYDRAFVIYDEHKKPCRMIGAMQDISKLKENEISLSELNENLQKQAKELSISNEELDKQNHILQDIAWTQSHIVREPLARMLGIVNIIKDMKVESPDYKEWINHFITSGNELDNIIKDIVNKIYNTKTI